MVRIYYTGVHHSQNVNVNILTSFKFGGFVLWLIYVHWLNPSLCLKVKSRIKKGIY